MTQLRATQSLCPVCLRRVDAVYVADAAEPEYVSLHKNCPEHGSFRVPVWDASHGGPAFKAWARPKIPSHPERPRTPAQKGCPYDCGLCPEHSQHTCTGLVEVTQSCSMGCPVCYASAGKKSVADSTLDELEVRFDALYRASGGCNVQLSGGEPTERPDLPAIIHVARRYPFGLLQLNTNGQRLAQEAGYAATLRQAGLDSVYLQWDGISDATFQALRGQPCLDWKHKALKACTQAGLGVVLVATVLRGVNDGEMGALVRLALAQGAGVRGVHFQPMAAFGRCPWTPASAPRLTLPALAHALETQIPDLVQAGQLHPPGCEHALCSCSAVYQRQGAGLTYISGGGCCDSSTGQGTLGLPQASPNGSHQGVAVAPQATPQVQAQVLPHVQAEVAAEGARKAKNFTALHWRGSGTGNAAAQADDFSRFVAGAGVGQRFTLSAMFFQDALSLDLDRVRGCCIHVVADDGRLIPFCLYNLTSEQGIPLYRPSHGA